MAHIQGQHASVTVCSDIWLDKSEWRSYQVIGKNLTTDIFTKLH